MLKIWAWFVTIVRTAFPCVLAPLMILGYFDIGFLQNTIEVKWSTLLLVTLTIGFTVTLVVGAGTTASEVTRESGHWILIVLAPILLVASTVFAIIHKDVVMRSWFPYLVLCALWFMYMHAMTLRADKEHNAVHGAGVGGLAFFKRNWPYLVNVLVLSVPLFVLLIPAYAYFSLKWHPLFGIPLCLVLMVVFAFVFYAYLHEDMKCSVTGDQSSVRTGYVYGAFIFAVMLALQFSVVYLKTDDAVYAKAMANTKETFSLLKASNFSARVSTSFNDSTEDKSTKNVKDPSKKDGNIHDTLVGKALVFEDISEAETRELQFVTKNSSELLNIDELGITGRYDHRAKRFFVSLAHLRAKNVTQYMRAGEFFSIKIE